MSFKNRMLASLLALAFSPTIHAAITVRDDAGNSVTLARPAQRVISMAPHITELLFAAGSGQAFAAGRQRRADRHGARAGAQTRSDRGLEKREHRAPAGTIKKPGHPDFLQRAATARRHRHQPDAPRPAARQRRASASCGGRLSPQDRRAGGPLRTTPAGTGVLSSLEQTAVHPER